MAVTMALMLIVFSAFFAISYVNDSYWYIVDVSNTLEWIAESGVFTNVQIIHNEEVIPEEITESDSLIIGVITDKNGRILSQQKIGKGKAGSIDQKTVSKILSQKEGKPNYRTYVYTVKELQDGNKLIVVQDTANKSDAALRFFGTVVFILFGIGALAVLTFFLSKFITEPARKALEREKQFVSDASHELKTPISAISINAQALDIDREDVHLKNILSETKRINYLIEKLLTLSKLEDTPLMKKSSCSLSDILNEIVLTYESVSFEKGITYQYDIKENITVSGDVDELKQLTAILIDNAIKYTDSPGLITINLFEKGSRAVFEVRNTGKGIAEKDLPHVFERFYTLGTSRNSDSYGLGLSIAKSIVERHKGTISVASAINEETVFTVTL